MADANGQMKPGAVLAWIVFGVLMLGGCLAASSSSGTSKSSPSGVGSSGYGSSGCASQGKQEFTSFNDPAWKRYIAECAPPGVK